MTTATATTHTQVIRAAQAAVAAWIAAETDHNAETWSAYRLSHADYVDVLRGISFYAVNEREVHASVPDTTAGSLWSYVASDALDSSAQFDDVFATGHIRRVSRITWKLTW